MAAGLPAPHGAAPVRPLQSALSRPSQQETKQRWSSRSDKVWSAAVLWEAGRQGQAHQGAPGVEGMALAGMRHTGDAEERLQTRHAARREQRSQWAPVRGGEMPKPQGGTSPLGLAPGQDRVVPPALQRVLAPLVEADLHDGADGARPKRAAKPASMALRDALSPRAWRVGAIACPAYGTRSPPRKLRTRITRRMADGSGLRRLKQTLRVGAYVKGQVVPTQGGGRQAPRSPRCPATAP